VMYLGRIMEIAGRDSLYGRPRHPYTRALLSAVHVPDPVLERSRQHLPLPGEIPSASEPIIGCRFRSRCFLYEALGRPERCAQEEPELRIVDESAVACHYAEEPVAEAVPVTPTSGGDVEGLANNRSHAGAA
jgi:peptide/nickel transport system ATP-binding protein